MLGYQKHVTVVEILNSSQCHAHKSLTDSLRYDNRTIRQELGGGGGQPRDEMMDVENNRKSTINERQKQPKERERH
jgi:hypothetical protein